MKIEKALLKKLLGRVSQNVPKKSIVAIVSNVLVEVKENKMRITGTDLQNVCYAEMPIETTEEFSFTVNCDKFKKALNMRGNEVEIKHFGDENERIVVSNGQTNVELSCLPVSDFPEMPKKQAKHQRTVSAKDIVDAINKVKIAVSEDNARIALTGVYLGFKNGAVEVAATNGKRICRCLVENADLANSTEEFSVILPMACVNNLSNLEFERVVKKEEEVVEDCDVTINVYGDDASNSFMIDFTQDMFSATSKLIQGTFPNITSFISIPDNNKIKVRVEASNLLEAMKFVTSFSENEIVSFAVKGNVVDVSVTASSENANDSVIVEHIGDDININFNPKYVVDVLQKIGNNEMEISFGESITPFSIVSDNYMSIVMPIRNA